MTGIWRSILVAVMLLTGAATAHAQNFPKLTGQVVDAANIIPDDQEAALTAKLAGVTAQSGRQFVVATVPDLQGYPIEDYGYQLGRTWGIGSKKENNGLILLVAPNDRKVRVEVGYGLEPIVTDLFSGVVIRDKILPAFKAGDLPGGINAGVDALAQQISLPPEEAQARAKALAVQSRDQVDVGAVIFWLFIFFFFILPIFSSLIFGKRRGRRYGSGPVIIWGGGNDWSGGSGSSWGGGGSSWGGGGGFSGGGGSFGGGGSSGSW